MRCYHKNLRGLRYLKIYVYSAAKKDNGLFSILMSVDSVKTPSSGIKVTALSPLKMLSVSRQLFDLTALRIVKVYVVSVLLLLTANGQKAMYTIGEMVLSGSCKQHVSRCRSRASPSANK